MSDEEKTPATCETSSSETRREKLSLSGIFSQLKKIGLDFYNSIWAPAGTAKRSLFMRIFSFLWRVVEITIRETLSNKIPLQAAALTYYVLMALAPFVMLVLTIFAAVMNVRGEEAVETVKLRIGETMQLLAPETTEAERVAAEADAVAGEQSVAAAVAPELQEFANNLLESTMANSKSAGTIGFVILAALAIFMIARVEDAYNLMWNVKRGRSWGRRFLVYFLFLVIGGAMVAVSASMLSVSSAFRRVSAMTGELPDWAVAMPGGEAFFGLMTSFVPTLAAFLVLTLAFASLNKYMPKTSVRWVPALVGGAFVAVIFIANQKLTMLYLNKISEFNSIYGNLGVIFILMFMLYMGWIFLLLGGQLSYAVQNARYLKNLNHEWSKISAKSKQEAVFACLFAIYEKCSRCATGLTVSELGNILCIPVNHVAECVSVLEKQEMIKPLAEKLDGEPCYNAAGTVAELSVGEIRQRFDNLREPLALGGDDKIRFALNRFSKTFEIAQDDTKMSELLANAEQKTPLDGKN